MNYTWTKSSAVVLLLLLCSGMGYAQFTASGLVTDTDEIPLIGVNVSIKGTALGTVTDIDGRYTIEVPGDFGTLVFSYIGFGDKEATVTTSSPVGNITMDDTGTQLDEVVITGLATTVKRSNLANSVAQIDAKELTGVTTQQDVEGALQGKFKGAEIRQNSGAPGGGMSVRLRGVTSIFGNQQPLYVIDGIYLDNSTVSSGTNVVTAAAGGGNTSNQDDASNRIADLDPEDIESIEILKGASAAAIYGSRAAGGVILITTKRGRSGRTDVTFTQTLGASRAIRLLGTRDWNTERVREVFGDADADLFNQNGNYDYENEIFGNTGFLSTSRLEFRGGTDRVNYFVGGTYKDESGIVENTGYQKASIRANVNFQLTDWLKLDVVNNYVNSEADRGLFNNSNSNTTVGYALAFTRPWVNLFADDNGNFPAYPAVGSNVLETISDVVNREEINRYIGGVTLQANIFTRENSSLKFLGRGGLDQYTLRSTSLFPSSLSYFRDPTSLGGVSVQGNTVSTVTNLLGSLTYAYYADNGLNLRASAGVTRETFDPNTVITTATGLNGSQTNLDQAANVGVVQSRFPQEDQGYFAQAEANFQDKVIGTLGIRRDRSTNNSDASEYYTYPKANLAVNLHEFGFVPEESALSSAKVRVAYGKSGRFPNFNDRFNSFGGTLIGGNSGLTPSTLRGNDKVQPEIQSEIEFGTDIGFLDNRFVLDFTYYIKEVDDLLLRSQLPTSTGFTAQVINGGTLENRGFEIGLNAVVVEAGEFSWNSTLNFWKNNSEITRLDVPAFNLGGFAASLGQYRIEEGSSATQIVGTYRTTRADGTELTPAEIAEIDPNGDGFAVYGDAEPDFNLTWNNNLSFGAFDLNFLWHWKQGSEGVNLSTLLYDLGGTTWDYDDLTLDPAGVTPNGDYRTSEWFAGNASPWIEDTGYIRLREVGLYYTFPEKVINDSARLRLGVSGRNLINIFDYNSYDPEVSNFGGNVLANNIEVTPFPSNKRFNFHIRANF